MKNEHEGAVEFRPKIRSEPAVIRILHLAHPQSFFHEILRIVPTFLIVDSGNRVW